MGGGMSGAMPSNMLAGDGVELRRELMNWGLTIAYTRAGREQLNALLQGVNRRGRATAVSRIGWHGGGFVLPDETMGSAGEEMLLLQTEMPLLDGFEVRGDLGEWHAAVGNLLPGNSRLILAASAALAAPLLHLANEESGGINFVGASSIGKSTAAAVAASIWGSPAYVRQWRATANGLEGIAAGHCDLLLVLDEMGQIDGREAGAVAYMLANGSGKSRASKSGSAKAPQRWRCLFLSTGEVTLSDKIAEDGRRRVMAGQAVRCLDIPADAGVRHGLFEDLHGAEDGDGFARRLKAGVAAAYGNAGRQFVRAIIRDREAIAADVRMYMAEFAEDHAPQGADGQVTRAAGRFALIAAAGELGAQLGILPIPAGAATDAAVVCFGAWLSQRGGAGAAEVEAALSQVARFLEQYGEFRFTFIDSTGQADTRPIINRAGFREVVDGVTQFYVLTESWRHEVCAKLNMKTVNAILRQCGFLHPDPIDEKSSARRRLPGIGTPRVYHVSADLLARMERHEGRSVRKICCSGGHAVRGTKMRCNGCSKCSTVAK